MDFISSVLLIGCLFALAAIAGICVVDWLWLKNPKKVLIGLVLIAILFFGLGFTVLRPDIKLVTFTFAVPESGNAQYITWKTIDPNSMNWGNYVDNASPYEPMPYTIVDSHTFSADTTIIITITYYNVTYSDNLSGSIGLAQSPIYNQINQETYQYVVT